MRKGKVVTLNSVKILDFINTNNILVIIVSLFIVGVIVGTFSITKIDVLNNYSKTYLENFISERKGSDFVSIMIDSLSSSLLFLLIVFAFGTSMLGVIMVPISAVARGILYGSVTALLYSNYSIKGVAFNAVLIIPYSLFFIIALILASRESIKFSLIIGRLSLPKTAPANLSFDFKNYCGRYLIIVLIVLFSSLIDALLSCSFINSFNF